VNGIAYDQHGRPRRGALIVGCGETQTGPNSWRNRERCTAVTDASGAFVLAGLPRERVEVTCEAADQATSEKRLVDTSQPNVPVVRFGAVPGSRTWRGRILDSDGMPLPGHGMVRFHDLDAGENRDVWSDREGSFAAMLPAGRWRAAVEHGNQGALAQPIGEQIDIGAGDVARDVRVVGKNLLCVVRFAEADAHPWQAESSLMLELEGQHTWNRPPVPRGNAHAMVWRGLSEGSYRLRSAGMMELLGAPECGLVVDLTGPAATNTIEVVLQPRAPTHR
jgi:hypothetical protein